MYLKSIFNFIAFGHVGQLDPLEDLLGGAENSIAAWAALPESSGFGDNNPMQSAVLHAVLMKLCTFTCVLTNYTQYSRLQSACKPRLHVNHGKKTPRFGENRWKIVKK